MKGREDGCNQHIARKDSQDELWYWLHCLLLFLTPMCEGPHYNFLLLFHFFHTQVLVLTVVSFSIIFPFASVSNIEY